MKKSLFLFISLTALFAVVSAFWWLGQNPSASQSLFSLPYPSSQTRAANVVAEQGEKTKATLDEDETLREKRLLQEAYDKEVKSNVPITFFGRVVDQDGSGIPSVKVKAEVTAFDEAYRFNSNSSGQKRTALELTTDERGFFTIGGIKGKLLYIRDLEKSGFQLESKPIWNFHYSGDVATQIHQPDIQHPVTFHMWREQGAEPLVQAEKRFNLGIESKVYTIDLLKRKQLRGVDSSGDLTVQSKRPIQFNLGTKYEWSFVIEVLDGGIMETNDRFLYLAPVTGYPPRYEFKMSADDSKWSENVTKKFYVRSRGGKVFSSMQVTMYSNQSDTTQIKFDYLANPSGSRNLEYDPEKMINKEDL